MFITISEEESREVLASNQEKIIVFEFETNNVSLDNLCNGVRAKPVPYFFSLLDPHLSDLVDGVTTSSFIAQLF